MSKFIYDVRCPEIVWLGRREENISRTVYIRVESILKKFPDASFYLKAKRPTEDNWYIAKLENIKVVDGILEWIVSSADVGIAGFGELEVHATSGDAKQISVLFKTKIDKTMEGTGGEIPPDVDDIIDDVINAGNAANEAAKNANDAADKANTAATGANSAADRANLSADKADSSSLKADEAAKNANSAADRVDTSITNANNAADEAKRSAQSANDAAVTANGSAANADDAAKRANDAAANAEGIAENVGNAEAERVLAENERVSFETERKKSEESRVAAEDLRKTGEEARISAETVREQSENERKSAETGRVQAETQRILAEESRVSSESERASAEEARASAENIRNTAEQERIENEDTRKTSESGREEAELHRVTAEELRAKAEQDRETGFNTIDISVSRGDKKATVKAVNPRGVETLADILDGKNTVAVSDTEPTDPDFDVWINPDAEMPEQYAKLSDIPKIDKTLKNENETADAKAVGDAIAAISGGGGGEEWELIRSITIGSYLTSIISIDTNQEGQKLEDLNFKHIFIVLDGVAFENIGSTENVYMECIVRIAKPKDGTYGDIVRIPFIISPNETDYVYGFVDTRLFSIKEINISDGSMSTTIFTPNLTPRFFGSPKLDSLSPLATTKGAQLTQYESSVTYEEIRFGTNAGCRVKQYSRFKVYGVRAKE